MKALRITLFILLGAAVAITVYHFGFRKSIPDAPVSEQVISILKQNDCLVCHSMDPQLPFYSSLPVIGPKMEEHSYHASRFTDLESKVYEDIDDVALTAPYFHDGTFLTLEAATKAMARYELGKELSDQDVCSIVAFMNTLTGDNPHMDK